MKYWKFKDYCSPAGNNKIREWYEGLGVDAQADCDTTLNDLAGTKNWEVPQINEFGRLQGKKWKPLGEVRWKTANVQHRIFGYFGADGVFILLIGATHKQRVYQPRNALDDAAKRYRQVERGEVETSDHEQ